MTVEERLAALERIIEGWQGYIHASLWLAATIVIVRLIVGFIIWRRKR